MKLTKSKLKTLIKEELQTVLLERPAWPSFVEPHDEGLLHRWEWLRGRLNAMENDIKQLIKARTSASSSPPPASSTTPQETP